MTATLDKPFSTDSNIFHISYEGGLLEDPWKESTPDMYTMAVPVEAAPDNAEYIEVEYEDGIPVSVNGKKLSPASLLERLNETGGSHGIGRVDQFCIMHTGLLSQ